MARPLLDHTLCSLVKFFSSALLFALWAPATFAAECTVPLRCASAPPADCPDPRSAPTRTRAEGDIAISQDTITLLENGDSRYSGHVEVRQGSRVLKTEELDYNAETQNLRIPNAVEVQDPNVVLRGERARVESNGVAEFEAAQFELPARAGHGRADRIRLEPDGAVQFEDVRYTTCPLPKPAWELKVHDLKIDQQARIGIGKGTRVDFEGIPIFYLPYISFPIGNEPTSGFLFPETGQSQQSGLQLSIPWYWRIASNYDATITPTYFSQRGLDFGGEFRYLTNRDKGQLNFNYLPDDRKTTTDRSYVQLVDRTDFTPRLRFIGDAINVSDEAWFNDLGGATRTSVVALPRIAQLQYRGDEWSASALAQNFQMIDPLLARTDRPYTVLPEVAFEGYFPDRLWGATAAFYAEFGAFQRNPDRGPDSSVQRFDAEPQLRVPLRASGVFVEPAVGYRFLAYHRDDSTFDDRTPSVGAPKFSIDGGMIFERESGASRRRILTLEPRLLYAYVPYRNQSDLPVLDTAPPDFNLIQLFQTERYAGPDRIGDIDHVAVGLTSRLIDGDNGRQYLTATVGELYRFAPERVGLPGQSLEGRGASDLIAELGLTAYRSLSAHVGLQWDPSESRDERTEVSVQYHPDAGKVVNVGYRFRRRNTLAATSVTSPATEGIKQVDASAAWPIGGAWSLYGRVLYSIKDGKPIERFGGFEYRSCCWGVRVLARRAVSTITGGSGWEYKAQLELTGLANVGHPVNAFLAGSIPGYSAARNDFSSTP